MAIKALFTHLFHIWNFDIIIEITVFVNLFERNMTAVKKTDYLNNEELDNLRTNIYKKLAQLDIKLPKLAELIGIPHTTLWRITNEGATPNIQNLYPIAKFFGVSLADLFKSPDLPQYLPILDISQIKLFLSDNIDNLEEMPTILSSEYIHEHAFAINLSYVQYGNYTSSIFMFKPADKLHEGNIGIIEHENNYLLVKLNRIISKLEIEVLNIVNNTIYPVSNFKVLAIAVKQKVESDLI